MDERKPKIKEVLPPPEDITDIPEPEIPPEAFKAVKLELPQTIYQEIARAKVQGVKLRGDLR